jgi:DNA polymerase III epsilon subunit-like protein
MNTSRTFYNIIALAKEDQSDIAAVAKRQEWMRNGNKWDDIIQGRELPHNTKYMVVDLETHDWKCNDPLLAHGRIVEIAWQLFSGLGECLESKQYLIKPYGTYKEIARKATAVHGITSRQVYEHGVDVKLVLDELIRIVANIPNDGFVIAHNMDHEHTVLTNSFSTDQRVVWDGVPKSDTMLVSLLKYLPSSNHHNKRSLSLSSVPILVKHKLKQLHKFVYQDQAAVYDYDYEHFADKDVRMTWEIFQYYQQHATVNELKWEESGELK